MLRFSKAVASHLGIVVERESNCFREVKLELDVAKSVNKSPILPTYDTNWRRDRPTDLLRRTLTLEEAYREAGVCMTTNPASEIDDSDPKFTTWTNPELFDAMETYFSEYDRSWPSWNLWSLVCGDHEPDRDPMTGKPVFFYAGLMFHASPGESEQRQGFAIFKNMKWFNDSTVSPPRKLDFSGTPNENE